jgi:hypothetical protein
MTQEILTVDQLAMRLKISRATVFVWIQRKIITQGKHYIKVGRVLRFLWSPDFLETISQKEGALVPVDASIRPPRQKKTGAVNWDY